MARHGRIELAVSEPIVNEIARILEAKLKWSPNDAADARRRIARFTTLVSPTETIDAIPADRPITASSNAPSPPARRSS